MQEAVTTQEGARVVSAVSRSKRGVRAHSCLRYLGALPDGCCKISYSIRAL